MINRLKKGQRKELLCQKELEKDGWQCIKTTRQIIRNNFGKIVCIKKQDFFGLFDIITVRDFTRAIQVKSTYISPEDRQKIIDWKAPVGWQKEIWIYKDRIEIPQIEIYK